MKKEKDTFTTKQLPELKDIEGLNKYTYKCFYWGPLLFKAKLLPKDLEECAKLCSKKSSFVNETLAGIIKHEHYVNHSKLVKILDPYLNVFRDSYKQWYGGPLDRKIVARTAWVNFMRSGEFNPPHTHSDCDFSSVFFIKIPEKIREEHRKFKGRGLGPGSISFSYGEPQPYSLCYKHFLPEEGDFFMFPATLTHYVCPFMSNEERVTISANFRFE